MPVKFYLLLGMIYVIVVFSFGIVIYHKDKKKKRSKIISTYMERTRTSPSEMVYRYMLKFPVSRGYIEKISRRYEMLCPGKPDDIANKTMTLTGIAFIASLAVLMLIYLLQPTTEHFILAVYIIFVINNEIINYYVNRAEIQLRMEQERFISNIGRNFFSNYYIDDAIIKAMGSPMSKEMRVHAQALYDITISNNMKDEIEVYNASSHDKFMKMLLSLCVNIVESSDGSDKENNMLTANLINLKKEINLDYLKMRKLQYVFSGSIFAAVIVCLPISLIQKFGLYISPELVTFYKGLLGILYVGIIYLCSFIVYMITNGAKEVKRPTIRDHKHLEKIEKIKFVKIALDNFNEKNYSRMMILKETLKRLGENITPNQLLIKCSMVSLTTFLLCIAFVIVMHSSTKDLILKNVDNVDTLSTAATEEQLALVKDTILYYSNKYSEKMITMEEVQKEVSTQELFQNHLIIEKISQEVVTRINKFQNEYFKYYELIICMILSLIAFFTPYWMILYRKKLMQGAMEDEVVQFHSIIYMMMFSDYITVADILEQMEIFAVVFKNTIRECLNEYNGGDIEALERMRDRETNASFKHLVSNLIRCDDLPISKAFNEITADRENYFERRKQEDEFSIQRKADSIKPLAFLPGILVMIYLILPIVVMSLKALQEVMLLLKESGMY